MLSVSSIKFILNTTKPRLDRHRTKIMFLLLLHWIIQIPQRNFTYILYMYNIYTHKIKILLASLAPYFC